MEVIVAATIAGVPATIAAFAAWKAVKQTRGPNGESLGELVYHHITDRDLHVAREEEE